MFQSKESVEQLLSV